MRQSLAHIAIGVAALLGASLVPCGGALAQQPTQPSSTVASGGDDSNYLRRAGLQWFPTAGDAVAAAPLDRQDIIDSMVNIYLALTSGIYAVQRERPVDLPVCGNALFQEIAKQAFAAGPVPTERHLTIVAMRNQREIAASRTARQCAAEVQLNNGQWTSATYHLNLAGQYTAVGMDVTTN